jgi:hypothetical protein
MGIICRGDPGCRENGEVEVWNRKYFVWEALVGGGGPAALIIGLCGINGLGCWVVEAEGR